MTFPEPHYVDTNGIRMAVYEQGPKDGVPVVMCHGFPEIAYSWRHQLPAIAGAGFRAIAPADKEAVIEALVRLSWLAYRLPPLSEIEINPLRVMEHGALALDARAIVLK